MKILYLMHIDWRWIKQRPHYIAEGLADHHELLVAYRFNPHITRLCTNESNIRRKLLLPIPRRWGEGAEKLDSFVQKIWLGLGLGSFQPDLIWLTFPSLYNYLPQHLRNIPIVYDCMDDAPSFFQDISAQKRIADIEARLIKNSSKIFCSSNTLRDRLSERCSCMSTPVLIRNGLSDDLLNIAKQNRDDTIASKNGVVKLAYIGTISRWFDFNLIFRVLDTNDNLHLNIVGPTDISLPKHEKITYHGVVEKASLPSYIRQFDAFIMPFVVNPLIEGVDPVKLYEYIATGKPAISVYYNEIERFRPFMHFYKNAEELHALLHSLCSGNLRCKSGREEIISFLSENTWEKRLEAMLQEIESLA